MKQKWQILKSRNGRPTNDQEEDLERRRVPLQLVQQLATRAGTVVEAQCWRVNREERGWRGERDWSTGDGSMTRTHIHVFTRTDPTGL